MMKKVLFLLMASALLLGAETLNVASAKGYKKPMTKLFKQFEATSGISVTPIFGNMRQVISQTELSGKVSVVVGDRAFLERSSLQVASMLPLGNGRLVLAYPKGSSLARIDAIADAEVKKIAMPDPKKAIYGKAATQYLKNSGLEAKVGGKLLTVGTVPQVSSYLIAGEIGYIEADQKLYTPIHIVCAVVAGHEGDKSVAAFSAFLKTAEARAILEASGL